MSGGRLLSNRNTQLRHIKQKGKRPLFSFSPFSLFLFSPPFSVYPWLRRIQDNQTNQETAMSETEDKYQIKADIHGILGDEKKESAPFLSNYSWNYLEEQQNAFC